MSYNMSNVNKKVNIKTKGSNNFRWSGGVNSYYKNHYQLKLNRREKLKQVDNKCESCGIKTQLNATKIDGDLNNHSIDNLRMLCSKCTGSKQNSKYKKLFGMTIKELCSKYNVPMSKMYNIYLPKYTDKDDMINALKNHHFKKTI